ARIQADGTQSKHSSRKVCGSSAAKWIQNGMVMTGITLQYGKWKVQREHREVGTYSVEQRLLIRCGDAHVFGPFLTQTLLVVGFLNVCQPLFCSPKRSTSVGATKS